MDYLHGDVAAEEADLACRYEYARESKQLWKLAKERDALMKLRRWSSERAVVSLYERNLEPWPCGDLGVEFLMCRAFPYRDWQDLSRAERKTFTWLAPADAPPFPMTNLWSLEAAGVFEAFKARAQKAKPRIQRLPLGKKAKAMGLLCPVLHWHGGVYRVLLDVDFSKSNRQLLNQFGAWLDWARSKQPSPIKQETKTGTTGKALDRLKDLATWRLYRELHNDCDAANRYAREHRKPDRPFHDARKGQSDPKPQAESDLGSEQSYFLKAIKRAKDYLAEHIPEESVAPSPPCLDDSDEAYLKQAKKVLSEWA
jgi:hypothetical protein